MFFKKKSEVMKVGVALPFKTEEKFVSRELYFELSEKYRPYLTEHFKIAEEIEALYSKLLNQGLLLTSADELISLCEKDISISYILKEYWTLSAPQNKLPRYNSLDRKSTRLNSSHRL